MLTSETLSEVVTVGGSGPFSGQGNETVAA